MADSPEAAAAELLRTGLRGNGVKKLTALDHATLCALVKGIGAGKSIEESTSTKEMVNILMTYKRNSAKAAKVAEPDTTQHAPHNASKDVSLPPAPMPTTLGTSDKEGPVSSRTRSSIWKRRYSLRICAFNALKLRLHKEGLEDDWKELIASFATQMDLILISEVRASDALFKSRAVGLLDRLNSVGESKWNLLASEASGPGIPELHILLYKTPIRVLRHQTLKSIDCIRMDHSPFCALLQDTRPGGGCFVVTSVHMPPEGRAQERDIQIARLLQMYGSRGETGIRLAAPFTTKGAADAKVPFVAHVIAGDWNTYMGDPRYNVSKCGFDVVFGKNTSTTAGRRAFDNFLLSSDTRDHYTISAKVLELAVHQNSHRSVTGVSDHSPIVLELERALDPVPS